jgi:hypothetical protein
MDPNRIVSDRLLHNTIGIRTEVLSNHFEENSDQESALNTFQEIIFQIREETPDIYAFGVLYALSLMSFTYAAPRMPPEDNFVPDEQWNLGYFVEGLQFCHKHLFFSADFVSGRLMKTDITYATGGKVQLLTANRGRGAERWLTHLQGKRHLRPIK